MLKLIFIFIAVNLCSVIGHSNFQIQNRRSDQKIRSKDLPVQEDLDKFLKTVEILTNYLANNKTYFDINFALGIFLVNVHLKRVLLDKGQKIPDQILSRINTIVDTNENSLSYFHHIAKHKPNLMERDIVIISFLFVNSTYWMHRLKKMKYEPVPTYSYSELEVMYSRWEIYMDDVDKVFKWNPSPKNSDVCLVTLSINPNFKGNSTSWCPVSKICYNMLTDGTNFGYALCHRLVILLMAQLGRGCHILLDLKDEELKEKLCSMAYAEAEYIAMNDYGIADLMLEIMALCSTDGRLQFLRRTWLYKMFDFQNKNGCFGIMNSVLSRTRRVETECNTHTTALAATTYVAAVRFILEDYY